MNLTVLIPAAGTGRRMQAGISKQYLTLDGRPILAHTLDLFERDREVSAIWLVAAQDDMDFCRREVVARYGYAKVAGIVPGGRERQDSVRNGLRACRAEEEGIVLIHDGVRPLLNPGLIGKVARRAADQGACVVGVPVKDTVKQVAGDTIVGTPERNTLWLAQTPQAFRFGLILDAHERALAEGFIGTDDASLVEWTGHRVSMLEGDYGNIKITTPEDLALAHALRQWRRGVA